MILKKQLSHPHLYPHLRRVGFSDGKISYILIRWANLPSSDHFPPGIYEAKIRLSDKCDLRYWTFEEKAGSSLDFTDESVRQLFKTIHSKKATITPDGWIQTMIYPIFYGPNKEYMAWSVWAGLLP